MTAQAELLPVASGMRRLLGHSGRSLLSETKTASGRRAAFPLTLVYGVSNGLVTDFDAWRTCV